MTTLVAALTLCSCASISGYPDDPVDPQSDLSALKGYFDPQTLVQYNHTSDPEARRQYRDQIVYGRVAAFDLMFSKFERDLATQANTGQLGGDLTVVALGALGATVGTLATKTALAAASGAVSGATGHISKDLYYEKTIAALTAQMDAGRATILARIEFGLSQTDAAYPLPKALIDLEAYKDAGSIPGAIGGVVQDAGKKQGEADAKLDAYRSLPYGESATSKLIATWIARGGKTNSRALQAWINNDKEDPALPGTPVEVFLRGTSPDLEADRQRAIGDKSLNIK